MKRIALTLIGCAAFALAGCDDTSGSLTNGGGGEVATTPGATGGGPNGDNHSQDPNAADPASSFPVTDPAQKRVDDATAGAPETVARLHSCGKISVASLGSILQTRGVNVGNKTAGSAGSLYTAGTAALGAANYPSRVPESAFATTSGATKQMDIFAAASSEVVMANWNPSACQSGGAAVKLFDATGNAFTKDGLSCLMGKPAKDEHVALANAAVMQASTPAVGKQIAIAALMSAAHTCE